MAEACGGGEAIISRRDGRRQLVGGRVPVENNLALIDILCLHEEVAAICV